MKILDSRIAMQSSHTYFERTEKSERLRMWVGNERPDFEGRNGKTARVPVPDAFIVQLGGKGMGIAPALSSHAPQSTQATQKVALVEGTELSSEDELKITIIEKMIEALTGKKIKIKTIKAPQECPGNECPQPGAAPPQQAVQQRQRQGWGVEYDHHEVHYEQETTTFSAQGVVNTADGRQINFTVDLSMSREFLEEQNISVRAGDAVRVDPLVINYGGAVPGLTDVKYGFDLDANGEEEQISFVGAGSGFLAVDRNEDGTINDGGELFGPASGDGFAELAQYDEDGNSWIDENDSIFSKLRIWSKDEQGNDYLFALGQKGIGALYLGQVSTPFAVKDTANELQGQISKTGIYLKENGAVGTIQHIDLAV